MHDAVASSPAKSETARPELPLAQTRPSQRRRSRRSVRAGIGITLIAVWSVATLTGVLLYVAPARRGSGQNEVLFGLTKTTWGDIHLWVSPAAVAVTIVHVIVDWKTFRATLRHTCAAELTQRVRSRAWRCGRVSLVR